MSHATTAPSIYGLVAEFDTPTELVKGLQGGVRRGLSRDGRVQSISD